MRGVNSNAYRDCNCNCYDTTIPDAYAVVTGIAYPDTIPDAYSHSEFTAHVTHANTYGDSPAQGNTKASADSASSAVKVGLEVK
jgi:hypothetical protein